MEDLSQYGGTPAVMRYLLDKNMLNGDCLTVTGKSLRENLQAVEPIVEGNPIIYPVEKPLKASGSLLIYRGVV